MCEQETKEEVHRYIGKNPKAKNEIDPGDILPYVARHNDHKFNYAGGLAERNHIVVDR